MDVLYAKSKEKELLKGGFLNSVFAISVKIPSDKIEVIELYKKNKCIL